MFIGLLGDNLIDGSVNTYVLNNRKSFGIYSGGQVMFNGRLGLSGKLDITAPETVGTSSGSIGICSTGKLSSYAGTINAYGTDYGIEAKADTEIGDTTVTAYGYKGAAWSINGSPGYYGSFIPLVYYGSDPSTTVSAVSPAASVYTANKFVRIKSYDEAPTVTGSIPDAAYTIGATASHLPMTANDANAKFQWQQSAYGSTWTNINNAVSSSYTPFTGVVGTTYYRCAVTGVNNLIGYS